MTVSLKDPSAWTHIAPYLDQALDRDTHERIDWLKELAVTQADVASAVRQLIAERDSLDATGFLTSVPLFAKDKTVLPALKEILRSGAAPDSDHWRQKLSKFSQNLDTIRSLQGVSEGVVLGSYRLIREIGHGGMSSVWLAERCDGQLKREVALKLPYAGPRRMLVERFQRERDILATLTHPNIARIYDAGVSESGQPYLAMEYVVGTSLVRYCDAASLGLRERLRVFGQVLVAMQFAHGHLVIHRDLKPSNILVTPDGRVVLLDFGIAKLLSNGDDDDESQLTQMGGRPLTLDYASPEQVAAQPLGIASDVYSLGVVLYELLVGQSPNRPKRDSRGALEDAILTDDPQRPSLVAIAAAQAQARSSTERKLAAALRGDLDTIVLKALKKKPDDRYLSIDAFLQDINNYLHRIPVSARPDSSAYRFGRFVSRHKLTMSASAITLLAIFAGGATAIWQARSAARERDHALALVSRNEAINDFTEMLITEAAASEKPMTVSEMLANSERMALIDTRGNTENRAAILNMIASRYYTLGDAGKAAQLTERALELVGDSRDTALRADLACHHASALSSLGQTDAAVRMITHELDNVAADANTAATCLLMRTYVAIKAGDTENALRFSKSALNRFHEAGTQFGEEEYLATLAYSYHLKGDNSQANRYFAQSLEKLINVGRDGGANGIALRNNWANVHLGSGAPKQALRLYDESIGILTTRDPNARLPAYLMVNHGSALEAIGRFAQARDDYEKGLRLAVQAKDMMLQAHSLLGLASIAELSRDRQAVAQYLERTTPLLGPSLPGGHPVLLRLAEIKGRLELADGNFAAAREDFDRVLDSKRKTAVSVRAGLGKAEANLLSGDANAAMREAQATLELAMSLQGGVQYSNLTGLAGVMLGRALHDLGREAEARKALEAALLHLSNTVDADHPAVVRAQRLVEEIGS